MAGHNWMHIVSYAPTLTTAGIVEGTPASISWPHHHHHTQTKQKHAHSNRTHKAAQPQNYQPEAKYIHHTASTTSHTHSHEVVRNLDGHLLREPPPQVGGQEVAKRL